MDWLTFIILMIAVIVILGVMYVLYYNAFQKYLIKINEVEGTIDISLRSRFDLLGKAATFIKEKLDKEVMKGLEDIKSDELTSFELERKLVALTKEFYDLKISNRDLSKADNFTNLDFSLRENEAAIEGYILYYNECISKYNKLVRMFPSNIVGKISKYKEKTYYDGKDLTDKKTDDVKI